MKKFLMSVALMSAIAIAAGYSMIGSDKSDMNVSDLASTNVEVLADDINKSSVCLTGGWGCIYEDLVFLSHKEAEPDV